MTETYDIRQHLTVLTPSKSSKTKYNCPVCDGSSLDIHPKTGAYNCFSGNCEPKDIREAIDKLEGKPDWKPEKFVKSVRPKAHKDYFYPDRDGNRLVKVTRKDDGSGKKNFYQNHWDGGKWVSGNPDEVKKLIPIYRYAEVQQAVERNELVFIVEGESTADVLWESGIPATTVIGGAGKFSKYGDYTTDFEGGQFVLTPDRDVVGLNHIKEIAEFLGDRVKGYYLAGTQNLWKKPDGGMDIADDIRDKGLTKEQILEKVISTEEYCAISKKEVVLSTVSDDLRCPYFESTPEKGLFRVALEKSGAEDENGVEVMKRTRTAIGNHLKCVAYVNNPEGNGAGLQLELLSIRGRLVNWMMKRGYIVSETRIMLSELMNLGYEFKLDKQKHLIEYLNSLGADVEKTYTVVNSTGWVNGRYISQHKTYGDGDYVFQQAEPNTDTATEIKGGLEDWKTNVGAKCDNNSRLIFVLGIAFAAPLLAVVGLESGGFHLMGDTSTGKTTAVKVAVSVTGEKDIPSWRTTANALEMTAKAHNHSMLPLDEIGQADEKGVGESTYMLRNGQGKSRSTKDLKARKVEAWRLIFLSTGEHSLSSFMAQAGKVQKGGQEVGMPDIPAVPFGSPYGVFESIHDCESSKEFAENLEAACQKYRGTAIDSFLTKLVVDRQDKAFDGATAARVFKAAKKLSEGTIGLAVSRVANRFALVQVALEVAHSYNILPFDFDRIEWAVHKMFDDWLTSRGGDGSIEIKQACDRIEHLIIVNEFSDRVYDPRKQDGQIVRNLLGHKISGIGNEFVELLVPTPVFDKEICAGVDKKALIAELQSRGWLEAPGLDGRPTSTRWVSGKKSRFYVFCVDRVRNSAFSLVPVVPVVPVAESDSVSGFLVEPDGTSTGSTLVPLVPMYDSNILPASDIEPENQVDDEGFYSSF